MRKVVYSGVLKFVAVILFIASIMFGVLTTINGIIDYDAEDIDIYSFESDFSDSWYVSYLLNEPENIMLNVYHSYFYEYDDNGNLIHQNENDSEGSLEDLATNIRQQFDDFYNSDKINYFVQWNDIVFTNCGAKKAEDLMQGEYFSYVERDSEGNVGRTSTNETRSYLIEEIADFDSKSTITIGCNIKQKVVEEYKSIWERQEDIVIGAFVQTIVYVIVALFMLVYLICVCGKNKDGEYNRMWLDNIWVEIHLAAAAGTGIGAVLLSAFVLDEYMSGHFPNNLLYLVLGALSALGSLIIITSLLSIIRNIKTRRLIKSSIILRVLKWIFGLMIKIAKWVWRHTKTFWTTIFKLLSKKTGVILISVFFVYTVLMFIMRICTVMSPIWLVLGILIFGFACFVVAYRAKEFDEIKKGVSEVRNGNVAYKIPVLKCHDMTTLAVNINDIAKGLDESVSAKVKAERLKSELITNVSHDLKTPITSIISYTELLSKIDELPEEARDYVSVIAKKSDRLKRLTQDLFDISKVQSGNEDVILEKLDVALLINQALGEHDSDIQSSGLPFCVEAPKELYISADGRKMSRVLSNLINNILKYTMKNTRVFITASEKDGTVQIEFKNISAYPLNFNVEEITQRFVRGDESRTAEGNGLGLAIAKSYTEICNGTFEIVVDGDMFKAILKFKKYV